MSTLAIKLVIFGAFAIGLALLVRNYFETREENKVLTGTVQQQGRTAAATTEIAGELGTATEGAAHAQAGIARQRAASMQDYEELRREDEDVRGWSDVRIPDRVRQLACERRVARERLGGAAPGSSGVDAGASACRFSTER